MSRRCATCASSQPSGLASLLRTDTAGRIRWMRRSRLVKVPSFSAKVARGSTTSAIWAAGVRKVSITARKSSRSRAAMPSPPASSFRMPLLKFGLSPMTSIVLMSLPAAASISARPRLRCAGRGRPQAVSMRARCSSSTGGWPPGSRWGTQPISAAPCALAPGSIGNMPPPALPTLRVSRARSPRAATQSWWMASGMLSIPYTMAPLSAPANSRAARAMSSAGTPVAAARSSSIRSSS